jgi:hypothetical protein
MDDSAYDILADLEDNAVQRSLLIIKRDHKMLELHESGYSRRRIADLFGLSYTRAVDILNREALIAAHVRDLEAATGPRPGPPVEAKSLAQQLSEYRAALEAEEAAHPNDPLHGLRKPD